MTTTKSIHAKLQLIQDAVQTVDKQGENTFSHYSYAMLGTMLTKLNPLLAKHQVTITQSVTESDAHLEFVDGGYYSVASVTVETTIFDTETTESLTVKSNGFAADKNGDKAAFKAITGARKYGITMMFKLHWDSVEAEQDTPKMRKSSRRPAASKNSDFF